MTRLLETRNGRMLIAGAPIPVTLPQIVGWAIGPTWTPTLGQASGVFVFLCAAFSVAIIYLGDRRQRRLDGRA